MDESNANCNHNANEHALRSHKDSLFHQNNTNTSSSLNSTNTDLPADLRVLLESITSYEDFASLTNIIAGLLSLPIQEWKALEILRASAAARPLLKEYFPQLCLVISDDLWLDLTSIQESTHWNEVRELVVSKVRCGMLPLYLADTSCQLSRNASSIFSSFSASTASSSARESLRSSLTSCLSRNCSLRTMQSIDEDEQELDGHRAAVDAKEAVNESISRKRSLSNDAKKSAKKQSYVCQVSDCRQRPYSRVKDLTNHFNNNHRAIFKDKTADEMEKIARGELSLYDNRDIKFEDNNDSSRQYHAPEITHTDSQQQNQQSQTSDNEKLYQALPSNSYVPLGREADSHWPQQAGISLSALALPSQPTLLEYPQIYTFDTPMPDVSESHQRHPSLSEWFSLDLESTPAPPAPPPNRPQSHARLGHRSLRDSMHIHPFRLSQ